MSDLQDYANMTTGLDEDGSVAVYESFRGQVDSERSGFGTAYTVSSYTSDAATIDRATLAHAGGVVFGTAGANPITINLAADVKVACLPLWNQSGQEASVQVPGQTEPAVLVRDGEVALVTTDGVDVREWRPVEWRSVPATATDPGKAGDKAYASGHLYVCVADDTWERVALATW